MLRVVCMLTMRSRAYGLLCVPFLHVIILVLNTCITVCTFVTMDTTTCILGSESQRTGWDVGLAWITSEGILVRCHWILGGGGGLHPSFSHCFQ